MAEAAGGAGQGSRADALLAKSLALPNNVYYLNRMLPKPAGAAGWWWGQLRRRAPSESAEASLVPSVTVPLDEEGARKIFKLIDVLEDSDDVQNVYANFDVSDDVMALIDA